MAAHLPLEILVADSRQVYRGMEIGTARPDAARRVLPGIQARGRLPLVVGGSGLYLAALVDGYRFGPPPLPEQRADLNRELATAGVGVLAARLVAIDPAAAARIDLRNPRRVARALERAAAPAHAAAEPWSGPTRLLGLSRPTDVLNRRIDERAGWLFANGLLEEVRALLDAGNDPGRAPLTSHGYGEAARYLAGEWSLEEAVSVTARRTRQYAKRQRTWFRRDPRIVWLDAGDGPADDPRLVAEAAVLLEAELAEVAPS